MQADAPRHPQADHEGCGVQDEGAVNHAVAVAVIANDQRESRNLGNKRPQIERLNKKVEDHPPRMLTADKSRRQAARGEPCERQ